MSRADRKIQRSIHRMISYSDQPLRDALEAEAAHPDIVRVYETEITPDEVMGEVVVGSLPPILLRMDRGRNDGSGPTSFIS